MSAVIADVTTNYAVDETMMLFPDKNKKSRQMRLYEQLNLKDSMPLVAVDTEIFSHEYVPTSVNQFPLLPDLVVERDQSFTQTNCDSWLDITSLVVTGFSCRGWSTS